MRYTAAGLVLALVLGGCVTPYQPRGFTGGYSDRRIDASTFHVSFKGNGYTPRQTVETAAIRRCAELTVQSGFDSFAVVGGNTDVTQFHYAMPGSYTASTIGTASTVGGITVGSAVTTGTYTPGPVIPIRKFESTLICRAVTGDPPGTFNARSVLAHLGGQVPPATAPAATASTPAVTCPGTSVWNGQGCISEVASAQRPTGPGPARPPAAALTPANASGTYSGTITGSARGQAFTLPITFSLVQSGERLTGVWNTSTGAAGTLAAAVKDGRLTDFRAQQLNPCPGEFQGVATAEDNGATFLGDYSGSDCTGRFAASFRARRDARTEAMMPANIAPPAPSVLSKASPADTNPTERPRSGTVLLRTGAQGRGELTLLNDSPHDAVVTLRTTGDTPEGRLVVYVRASDRLTLGDIANGEYDLEFTLGRGWTGSTFANPEATFKMRQPLTYEDMLVTVRGAEGTRTTHVPGDSWTVTLRTEDASQPPVKPVRGRRSTR